jgi:hypothetical protein
MASLWLESPFTCKLNAKITCQISITNETFAKFVCEKMCESLGGEKIREFFNPHFWKKGRRGEVTYFKIRKEFLYLVSLSLLDDESLSAVRLKIN